jgi:hypothetical protein
MAERERPADWQDWKWLHRWPRLSSPEWALEWLVYWCRGLAIFEVLEFVGRASVLIAAITWIFEAGERDKARMNEIKQKHYRAWELINSARGSTGDGGRRDALRDLNEDKVNLSSAPLTGAFLRELQLQNADMPWVRLNGANLYRADLTGSDLFEADLHGSFLAETNLSKVNLSGAHLPGANLMGARLIGADLSKADLSEAKLGWADLSGADLSGADLYKADLTNIKNLDTAQFCLTIMPDGTVNNRDCPPEPASPPPSETPPVPN